MINAIIPARGGSKGVPQKNIALIGNTPLLVYSIKAAQQSGMTRITVSTDDKKIAKVAKKYKGVDILDRPEEYATDTSSDYGYLKHYFENVDCEEVALLRPTTPFRNPIFMLNVLDLYSEYKDEMTGLRSAHEMSQPAHKQLKIKDGYFQQLFDEFDGVKNYSNLPRQNFPCTYSPNGHIDIVKRSTIEQGEVFGDKIFACISEKTIDIDDEFDLHVASLLADGKYDYL